MELLNKLLDRLEVGILVASFVGAVAAIKFQDELNTWRGKLSFIGTGMACAYYGTPIALTFYSIDARMTAGVGFLLGAFGGSLLAAGFRAIKNLDPVSLVKGVFGKTGSDGE